MIFTEQIKAVSCHPASIQPACVLSERRETVVGNNKRRITSKKKQGCFAPPPWRTGTGSGFGLVLLCFYHGRHVLDFIFSLLLRAGSSEQVAWKSETEGRRDLNEKSKHYQQRTIIERGFVNKGCCRRTEWARVGLPGALCLRSHWSCLQCCIVLGRNLPSHKQANSYLHKQIEL